MFSFSFHFFQVADSWNFFFECGFFLSFFLAELVFICRMWISLVAVCRLFGYCTQALMPCGMRDLSSPTRDQTHVPCIGRQILNLWISREVPGIEF